MRIKRTIVALVCTSALFFAGCSATDTDESSAENQSDSDASANGSDGTDETESPEIDTSDLPDVVAKVNDVDITKEVFLVDYEVQFDQAVMTSQGTEIDQDALKLDVADMIINRELLIQAAASEGIEASEEKVDEVLADVAAQSGLGSVEEFLELAAEQGIDADTMRSDASNQYLINTYIDEHVDVPDTSEEELQSQYDEVVETLKEQGANEDEIPAFEDVRDQLNAEAKNAEMGAAVEDLLEGLREAAEVSIYL